jgi:putative endonuclease
MRTAIDTSDQSICNSAIAKRSQRQARERKGRLAEIAAAALLIVKGYRILEWRVRGPFGEIDLIAVRGRRLAFVEVKSRRSIEKAQDSISFRQSKRIRAAAQRWVWRHPAYREHEFGMDAVLLGASFVPVHIPNALQAP